MSTSIIDLATLTATQGFIIQGDATYDPAGHGVLTAGDVNGDGVADLTIMVTGVWDLAASDFVL
jgi:hypothetical protein